MGFTIIIGVLTLLGIALVIYDHWLVPYSNIPSFAGWTLTLGGGFIIVTMLITAATLETEFAYTEDQYNNLKEQLEYVERDDIVTGENLRNQVLDMNNTISKHKRYSQNWWVGMWHSKRIGNLEPLEWKSRKPKEE